MKYALIYAFCFIGFFKSYPQDSLKLKNEGEWCLELIKEKFKSNIVTPGYHSFITFQNYYDEKQVYLDADVPFSKNTIEFFSLDIFMGNAVVQKKPVILVNINQAWDLHFSSIEPGFSEYYNKYLFGIFKSDFIADGTVKFNKQSSIVVLDIDGNLVKEYPNDQKINKAFFDDLVDSLHLDEMIKNYTIPVNFCDEIDKATWRNCNLKVDSNSLESLSGASEAMEKYLDAMVGGKFRKRALKKIKKLDDHAILICKERNSISAFEDYINLFPNGNYSEVARENILRLEEEERIAKEERRRQAELARKLAEEELRRKKYIAAKSDYNFHNNKMAGYNTLGSIKYIVATGALGFGLYNLYNNVSNDLDMNFTEILKIPVLIGISPVIFVSGSENFNSASYHRNQRNQASYEMRNYSFNLNYFKQNFNSNTAYCFGFNFQVNF